MLATTIALNRFGLGARPDDPPPADTRRWLLQQFDRFEPRPLALAQVPSRAAVVAELAEYIKAQRMFAQGQGQLQPASMPTGLISYSQRSSIGRMSRIGIDLLPHRMTNKTTFLALYIEALE